MKMAAEELAMKNGKTCILRSVEPEDAECMISYMKVMLGETPYLLRSPEEFDYSIEGEAEVLRRRRDDPRALMILADSAPGKRGFVQSAVEGVPTLIFPASPAS